MLVFEYEFLLTFFFNSILWNCSMGGYGNHEHMHYPHALMQNLWMLMFLSFLPQIIMFQ